MLHLVIPCSCVWETGKAKLYTVHTEKVALAFPAKKIDNLNI